MDNVIQFPTKLVRERASIERLLKERISQFPIDQQWSQKLIDRLLAVWERYQHTYSLHFSLPLPPSTTRSELDAINSSLQQTVETLSKDIQEFTYTLFTERMNLELELYFRDHPL